MLDHTNPHSGIVHALPRLDDVQPDRAFVVHGGEERYPKGSGVEAVGLRELASELAG